MLLGRLPHADPALESGLLLRKAAGISEGDALMFPERPVPAAAERRFFDLVEKRRARVPLAYLTGEHEFWSISFAVFPGVLIPRPETELVVEKVVALSSRRRERIADIGTGSGNIAVALAGELPNARIIATDISRRALKAARLNAGRRNIHSITFVEGNALAALEGVVRRGSVDFVVSNPPYVSAREWRTLEPEVRGYEPKRALVAGTTGLEFIRRLIDGSRSYLKSGGHLVFEIGAGQADEVVPLFDRGWADIRVGEDLRGIPRVVSARKARAET
jgi:release factor glutamine methyltransferase